MVIESLIILVLKILVEEYVVVVVVVVFSSKSLKFKLAGRPTSEAIEAWEVGLERKGKLVIVEEVVEVVVVVEAACGCSSD